MHEAQVMQLLYYKAWSLVLDHFVQGFSVESSESPCTSGPVSAAPAFVGRCCGVSFICLHKKLSDNTCGSHLVLTTKIRAPYHFHKDKPTLLTFKNFWMIISRVGHVQYSTIHSACSMGLTMLWKCSYFIHMRHWVSCIHTVKMTGKALCG